MSIFKFRVSWSKANNRVVLRPIEKDTATVDKLFNILTSTNNLITEIEVDTDKNQLASIDQMRMYRACLLKVCEQISDVSKTYTKEELHIEVKRLFAEFILDTEGVDLFDYEAVEVNGEILKKKVPKSFNRTVGKAMFSKYINFFQNYIIAHYNIDPFSDFKEREYKSKLIEDKIDW